MKSTAMPNRPQPLRLRHPGAETAWWETCAGKRFVARPASASCQLALRPCPCPSPELPRRHAQGEDGGLSFVGVEAFCALLTGIDPAAAERDALRQALTESAFALLPGAIADLFGSPALCAEPPATAADCWMRLICQLDGARAIVRIGASAPAWRSLLAREGWKCEPQAPLRSLQSLPLHFAVTLGEACLTARDYADLGPGDLIRPHTCWFEPSGRGALQLGHRHIAVCWDASARALRIEQLSLRSSAMNDCDASVRAIATPEPAATPPSPLAGDLADEIAALAQHSIRLRFLLGGIEISLGELARLAPGQLLRLQESLPPTVSILANGMVVGYGELVELDARLAIQISTWNPPR